MGVVGLFSEKDFERSFVFEAFERESVNEIGSGENTFTPKFNRKVGLKLKCSSGFQKVTMFSFNNSVLLRGVTNASLVFYSIGTIKFFGISFT